MVKEHPIALRHIDRFQYVEVGRILDHPVRIPGSQIDVLDDRVRGVVRIHLTVGGAGKLFELPDAPERRPGERR